MHGKDPAARLAVRGHTTRPNITQMAAAPVVRPGQPSAYDHQWLKPG